MPWIDPQIRCSGDPAVEAEFSQCIFVLPVCRAVVLHLEPDKISLVPSCVCSHFADRQGDMVASASRAVYHLRLAETSLAFASIVSKLKLWIGSYVMRGENCRIAEAFPPRGFGVQIWSG